MLKVSNKDNKNDAGLAGLTSQKQIFSVTLIHSLNNIDKSNRDLFKTSQTSAMGLFAKIVTAKSC